jgi:hypothetical protein
MSVVFTANYFLLGDDILIDNETLLMIDFVNLKIKLTQYFKYTYKGRVYMYMFIELIHHINIYI